MPTQDGTNPSLVARSGALSEDNDQNESNNSISNDENEKENSNRGNGTENPTTGDKNPNKYVTSRPVHGSLQVPSSGKDSDPLSTDLALPSSSSERITAEEEFQFLVRQQVGHPGVQMAARNNRPRTGFKPEQGAAAQEERNMWETIKSDMMRANSLQKQSNELVKQLNNLKARCGNDWKSMFVSVLYMPFLLTATFVGSFKRWAHLDFKVFGLKTSHSMPISPGCSIHQLFHLSVELLERESRL